jgi:hypothetical protein
MAAPGRIRYRLTGHPHDFHRAQALLRDEGRPPTRWYWPTVLAEEGPELVAVLGTSIARDQVHMGPLVLARALGPRRGAVIAYRLAERWEAAAYTRGIRLYYLRTPPGMPQWARTIARLGYERLEVPGDPGTWWRRWIGPWGATRRRDKLMPVGAGFHEVPDGGWTEKEG